MKTTTGYKDFDRLLDGGIELPSLIALLKMKLP